MYSVTRWFIDSLLGYIPRQLAAVLEFEGEQAVLAYVKSQGKENRVHQAPLRSISLALIPSQLATR